jgi:hypothetical protein
MNIKRTKISATSANFVPGMTAFPRSFDENQETPRTNGLQNLVEYYQNLFDKEEFFHYGPDIYQDTKRKFVKYLLTTRTVG